MSDITYTRNLIETSLDALVTISIDGKIMDVNQATIIMTGVERDMLIGSNFCSYFTDPDKAREGYHLTFLQGRVKNYALDIKHISGRVTPVLCNASVYKDDKGKIVGIFAAARDMTEINDLRKIEDELRQSNADLESFSYSISHDLRAPLRAIDGFISIIQEDYTDKLDLEGRRLFQIVRDNAKHMSELIDDILHLSRTSRHEIIMDDINIMSLFKEIWEQLPKPSNARLIISSLPNAYADIVAIREVIQNLLDNAIKFSYSKNPIIVEVNGYKTDTEVIYSVKDNGVGFNSVYIHKLFGMFQRLHGVEEFDGTGIGLAIVKKLITKHNGRVWAESENNNGATFYFALPVRNDND